MGLFTRKDKEEDILLKYASKLTPEDLDRLVRIAKNIPDDREHSTGIQYYLNIVKGAMSSSNAAASNVGAYKRKQLYEIYDEMDESTAYISSALDILSDDATQPDADGEIIHVFCENTKVVTLIQEFLDNHEIPTVLSKWARYIAKYGDFFIKVEGTIGEGITYINDTIYPSFIERRDLNGKLVAFTNSQSSAYSNEDIYPPWDFVHFRHKGDIYRDENLALQGGLYSVDQLSNNTISSYGQSILKPAIKVYAQLRFVENLLLLSRLTNSIKRNIFLINTAETDPNKAFERVRNYADLLKKNINFDLESQIYSSSKHTVSYDEDIFLPVSDTSNDIRIESIGGDTDVKEAYDLDYLQNKLFSALKVPKAYLNYEQDLNARSTLIQLDIRYARSVYQLQQTIIAGLTRLINIHLSYLGLNPVELEYDINLTPVSSIDEEARTEQLQNKVNVARDTWDLLTNIQGVLAEREKDLDLDRSAEILLRDYIGLDAEDVKKILGKDEEDIEVVESKSFRKSYCNLKGDSRAPYPLSNTKVYSDFEVLRENLVPILNKELNDKKSSGKE